MRVISMRFLSVCGCAAAAAVLLTACSSGFAARTSAPPATARSGPGSGAVSGASDPLASTPPGPSASSPAPVGTSSSTPQASGRTTTTASPVRAETVHVLADCASPSVRPASIVVTCADAGVVVEDIQWAQWGETSATGTASFTYNDCRPDCAQGHHRTLRGVRITLTAPVASPFGFPLWSRLTADPVPQGFNRTLSLSTKPVG